MCHVFIILVTLIPNIARERKTTLVDYIVLSYLKVVTGAC